jgi:Uncharacterised nucleotidyltransferase
VIWGLATTGGWPALLATATAEHLEGLLLAAVDAGEIDGVTDEQREEALAAALAAAGTALCLERRLLGATATLDAAGIEHRVLKGSALAHLDYPDPSWRGSGDVDLLIPSDQWDAAIAALTGAGARRTLPPVRAGFEARFGKEATLVDPADGIEVDLHRTLVIGPLGLTLDLDALFAAKAPFEVGGRTLAALGTEERFLNACYAALADDRPALRTLRDIGQLLLVTGVDADRVLRLATAWQARLLVADAVRAAERALATDLPLGRWARQYRPSRRERLLVATYHGRGRSYASQAASLAVIPGLAGRAAYLRAMAWPDAAYLQARGLTRGSHWGRALAALRPAR